ncbi:hypothetical protein [Pseudomonas phage pPA-3099-2aT.2]|uniref:Uncharacterized protein n=1 Tax=Pseudomonas phage pPA-3099-2aT.2 TaxID=3003808 RepID=A0AAE9W7S0_9CAUD|nr:hypothetical protein QE325_gp111 [Pseudomonas phage pPA-3099-2aT.2]WBQ35270.1 hypothetical protein [Pseudomonas phage pPA-3099-2aT.2]
MSRAIKAQDFDLPYQFEAAKRAERKQARQSRDARKAGRGRVFQTKDSE